MRTVIRNSYTPQTGDYCNKIVVDQDKSVQYIFDSDGVWTTYTSKQQEGAPKSYVDSRVNGAINETKTYADAIGQNTLQTAKAYADAGDVATLEAAKAYADSAVGSGATKTYVDQQDANVLQQAKDYADSMDVVTLSQANDLIGTAVSGVTSNLGGEIQALQQSLSPVATTGAYSDLTGLPTIPVITMTSTDPGEGVTLEANHFIAVYSGGA